MAMGKVKQAVLVVAIIATVKITVFAATLYVYGHNRPEPPGTFHAGSPTYGFVSDCFEMIGSTREEAGLEHFAFCQCYATELQHRQIDKQDFPLLLQVIEGERPTATTSDAGQATPTTWTHLPPHLQDLVDSTLPECRGTALKVATTLRTLREKCESTRAVMEERREALEKHGLTPPSCDM